MRVNIRRDRPINILKDCRIPRRGRQVHDAAIHTRGVDQDEVCHRRLGDVERRELDDLKLVRRHQQAVQVDKLVEPRRGLDQQIHSVFDLHAKPVDAETHLDSKRN